ncbi:MAG TPA: phospho-N-acetylmuramoyl-pentapeptide-transferase [bacterium]|nr:phospho-N-acetylmuramoyl-pentapeptide-transferase [bacterium]HQG46699.1 phospho-N-acetylmuramoyl-pentapeptide-transferase [bacterium]HQI48276.1 phospho-N-acetylmuramoyl-pentapeptide-transferase [bacterium]HQJ64892.1 phospho-N-acetylmuramoyl-pentapeptide-transferase [bacterium]
MLYYLLEPLKDDFILFNLFRYISFRAASAVLLALLLSLLIGPVLIRKLREMQIGEEVRVDGPQTHLSKRGTPSMGGILILVSTLLPTLLLAKVGETCVWVVMIVTLWLGMLGLLDDYLKIVKKMPKGLIGRYKLVGQITIGLFVGLVVYFLPTVASERSSTTIPFLKDFELEFGFFYIFIVAFVITAMSNGSNLTDGLDGLLIGLIAIAATAFGLIAYVTGRVDFSDYLNIIYLPEAGELAVFCAALFGAALGFLWYNAYPAQVFMGDTGALALGGAIGAVAVLVKKELLLLLICAIFVIESLSVILQVGHYKRTGRRIFRMAPIHHHFELSGWAEPKVVIRFWIVGIILALLTLTTFKIR